jgi:hydroxymethylglutaryl-CoA lyase
VIALAEALMQAGCDEVGLADTSGYANPAQVRDLVRQVHAAVGAHALSGLHLHNTRGLGLANVIAGLEVGITTFDSSLGGLGGCPFAPGASGNIVTEDLVFMLEAMGLRTGIDLPKLLRVRGILREALPGEPLYGFTPDAGLPLGFAQEARACAPSMFHLRLQAQVRCRSQACASSSSPTWSWVPQSGLSSLNSALR